jgi:hypothetical protein
MRLWRTINKQHAGGLPPGLAGCSFFLLFNQKKQISRKQILKIVSTSERSRNFRNIPSKKFKRVLVLPLPGSPLYKWRSRGLACRLPWTYSPRQRRTQSY